MKKYITVMLAMLLAVSLAACSNPSPTSSSTAPPVQSEAKEPARSSASAPPLTVEKAEDSKILIAYFTWAENTVVANPDAVDVDAVTSASVLAPGNTAQMAAWIQQEMGGDLFSMVVNEPYPSDYDECLDRAADEKADNTRPMLTNRIENIEDYDVIFLGYPNWWYTAPMAVFSFIEEYDLSGKTVIPFCAHGTGGLASSVQDITAALPNSTVLTPIGVNREDVAGAQEPIKEWLAELSIRPSTTSSLTSESAEATSSSTGNPLVYMTTDISSDGLMSVYNALGARPSGNIAVKLSTGEAGGNYYLQPELIQELVQTLDGTIVECNTAYGGSRANTAMHLQVAKDHGFTEIADVDIMDADGSVSIPVEGGTHLTENFVGAGFADYDYFVVLSHFKGHSMGGFGGAIKNISIGIASGEGKGWIHSGGTSKTNPWGGAQNDFLESMAEAATAVSDSLGGNMLYISVMNNLSVDCDCESNPAKPDMHDIGILASLDPVALDQACVDLVYAAEDGASLIERIESRNGILTLEHAEKIGLGSRSYDLIAIAN